jgi:hypothetical protein
MAYNKLYSFVAHAQRAIYSPSDPPRDFIHLMRTFYYKDIKPNTLLFTSEIRDVLQEFESQYKGLIDEDLTPEMPFSDFIGKHELKLLRKLSKAAEKRTDEMLHTDS